MPLSTRRQFAGWNEPGFFAKLGGATATPILEQMEPVWRVGRFEWNQVGAGNRGDWSTYETGVTASGEIVAIGDPPTYRVDDVTELRNPYDITLIGQALQTLADKAERRRA
ncbi:hypothetical protein O7631_30935 [Micromonospora sp. WMMD967]|uniref:hypothetical protein n=1 Tax=Micromonospora sp. WMMD967 TaxID=3016101 RepID=UPI0024173EB0|nr:hypothetical protein [Micromonospora sp. WMMD967]MDG4840963.1 hypothetical protein [Micromonospora sp. WMMD967]